MALPVLRFFDKPGTASVLLAPLLAACANAAVPPLAALPSTLHPLAIRAAAGDKQAQLELGIAFEEGQGVPPDTRRARALYQKAAEDEPHEISVYAPSPGGGAPAMVTRVRQGIAVHGLEEARLRLLKLNASTPEQVRP